MGQPAWPRVKKTRLLPAPRPNPVNSARFSRGFAAGCGNGAQKSCSYIRCYSTGKREQGIKCIEFA
jgi:hypothetical protein